MVIVGVLVVVSTVQAATTISTNIATDGTLTVSGTATSTFAEAVGIGTTTPNQKLSVNGNVAVTGAVRTGESPDVTWGSTFSNFVGTSDLSMGGSGRVGMALLAANNSNWNNYNLFNVVSNLNTFRQDLYMEVYEGSDGTAINFRNTKTDVFMNMGVDGTTYTKLSPSATISTPYLFNTSNTLTNESFLAEFKNNDMPVLTLSSGGSVAIGVTPSVTSMLKVATSTNNATTSIEIGKASQNKGACLVMYDVTGAVKYVSIVGTSFVISATSCQ